MLQRENVRLSAAQYRSLGRGYDPGNRDNGRDRCVSGCVLGTRHISHESQAEGKEEALYQSESLKFQVNLS